MIFDQKTINQLRKAARGYLLDKSQAKDAVQDAFLAYHEHYSGPTDDEPNNPLGYMYRVLKNVCYKYNQDLLANKEMDDEDIQRFAMEDNPNNIIVGEILDYIIDNFSRVESDILQANIIYGKEPSELARDFIMPVKKIENILYRSKQKIIERFKR